VPTEIQALLRNLQPGVAVDPSNAALAAAERNLQELLYTLCEEFRRSEFFVRDQKSRADVGEVLLCGGGACLPFAVDYLTKHLSEKKVDVLNPFATAKSLPDGTDVKAGPLWACALGLALRG
jgi:Tfp pilus assembly PilM family ATPase